MSNMISLNEIKVGLCFSNEIVSVGRLATRDHNIYFEYNDTFIDQRLNISSIKLIKSRLMA